MIKELDDYLLHAGVKGMKWGVVKDRALTGAKNHVKKRNDKAKATAEKFHAKKMTNKKYKKSYEKHLKRYKGNHEKAVREAMRPYVERNRAIIIKATPALIATGKIAFNVARHMATSPEAVRAGRNTVQAMKNSPIRYVDGKKFNNVVDMSMPLSRR